MDGQMTVLKSNVCHPCATNDTLCLHADEILVSSPADGKRENSDVEEMNGSFRRYRVMRRVTLPRNVMASLLPSRVFIVTSLFPWSPKYGLSSTVCIRADLVKSDIDGRHYYSCAQIVPFPQQPSGLIHHSLTSINVMSETIFTWKRLLTAWIYQKRICKKEAEMASMLSMLQEEKETLLICLERERMKNEEALVNLSILEKEKDVLIRREVALEAAGKELSYLLMNMRAGRDELITSTNQLRDQVTVLQRSLEEEHHKRMELQSNTLVQNQARDVETATLQRSLHQSEAKVIQLEADAIVAADATRAAQAETQALRNELIDNEKTMNKMKGEYEILSDEKKQLELTIHQQTNAVDSPSNDQLISPIQPPLNTTPIIETIYSSTRTSLQRLQERQKILLLEAELATKEAKLVETSHRVKTLERDLETVVTQLEEVESQRDHLRVATAHARFGARNRLGSSEKGGPSPSHTIDSLRTPPASASTKDTIPTPSSTKSLSFSLSYLGSRSFSSSSPSSALRGVNGSGRDFSSINITPPTPAPGDQSCNASSVGSNVGSTSFSLKDLDLEVTSSISGFADTSDDEASSLGVFNRDHIHDTKSEDAWTDRSSVTPPFTAKKVEVTTTSPTSPNNGETTLLSVFSLQSFGFTSLFNTQT